ncbi:MULTISPECIES: CidA/LrgA family protein [unclassified Motilimonas]|uniref:CidA/LrgA family protein n=1 Tax=Motilimonas TaxID=1914248 RepID=UPI001E32BA6D|nr:MULTISPECIES: CidA/LrgA family protein [unclassified Motilimonas]MCE0555433.1 CidA/LrgA family protein [Motilimonas sp. E26]MDO6526339.1 CidA/LrgA family protein [Motilimonas sp. 1_MG-2023]
MFSIVRAFAIILLALVGGKAVAYLLPFNFPASIIGMLVLFIGFNTGVVKVHWVQPGAHYLLKYMALLFIPIGVGLINYFDLVIAQWPALLASITFGTFIVMAIVGHVFQRINPRD